MINKKIKLGFCCADINPKKTKSLGIYTVVKNLLRQLGDSDKLEVYLILSKENKNFFKNFKCKKRIQIDSNKPYFLKKFFIFPSMTNKIAKKENLDILFFPKGHLLFSKNNKTKYYSFIHDLIPFYYLKKQKFSFLPVSLLLVLSMRNSDKIFTNSEYSKDQIRRYAPNKKIIVIPLGFKKIKTRNLRKKDFVFIIGNNNPHKNLDKSIKILREYNHRYNTKYKILTANGRLPDKKLAEYYKISKFSMFLSDIEGFGLPFIESYSYDTPVVFNSKSSLKELGKGLKGACLIENKETVFKAINEVSKMKKKEITTIKNNLQKRYNWLECKRKLIKELV